MERSFGNSRVVLIQGDITKQAVDAVVNAANSSLLGGGGVDGAIHRVGGTTILDACRAIVREQGCLPPGQAVITPGGNLPARYVIHTVGPIWRGGAHGEPDTLRGAYQQSLALAEREGLATVAFPSISTGAYGYPLNEAARVALQAISELLAAGSAVAEVRFVLFSQDALTAYEKALSQLAPG